MRRIYESRALEYDDEDPHAPKRKRTREVAGPRTVDWGAASHALLPRAVRAWAVEVDVETDREVYAVDEPVGFEVRLVNRIPFPVSLRTDSPVRWSWAVDGLAEASRILDYPEEADLLEFGRSERKVFRRKWSQRVRESPDRWAAAERGEHTLSVRINAPGAEGRGLTAETTFRIE
jgi:hypothetical protein